MKDKSTLAVSKRKRQASVTDLVKVVDNVPVVSTLDMWKPLAVEHNALLKMIRKYENKFSESRPLGFEIRVGNRGGSPVSFCYLDEEQAIFLISLMRNSDPVVDFKHRLSREFVRMKTRILQLQAILYANRRNAEWLETRTDGKIVRKSLTDTVKNQYMGYAKNQGSEHSDKLYISLSKTINKALFDVTVKTRSVRDLLDVPQLKSVSTAEFLTEITIKAGMELELHYKKEINPMCKDNVESFAAKVGKTPVPRINVPAIESHNQLRLT